MILTYISAFFPLLVTTVGFFRIRFLNKTEKIILTVMVLSLLTEAVGRILDIFFKKHNMFVLNSYVIIETLLLSIFYVKVLANKRINMVVTLFLVLFIVISVWQMLTSHLPGFNHISMSLESVWMIFLSFFTFYHLMHTETDTFITQKPVFWFNTGFLIFFCGNLFVNLVSRYYQHADVSFFSVIWNIYCFLNITQYILIIIGFWKTKERLDCKK